MSREVHIYVGTKRYQNITTSVVNREFNMASSGIFSLAADDTIELSIRTTTAGTPDLNIHNCNLVVVMIGG